MFKGSRLMKREPFLIETKKRIAIFVHEEYYSFIYKISNLRI